MRFDLVEPLYPEDWVSSQIKSIHIPAIKGVASFEHADNGDLCFYNGTVFSDSQELRGVVILARKGAVYGQGFADRNVILEVDNPRLMFVRALAELQSRRQIVETEPVIIGRPERVGVGTVIGSYGFGYERNERDEPEHFPHLGSVRFADGIAIGANVVIARGTLSDTIVGANTKIDDLVYIAHNCCIGENVMIAGNATLCGGVKVGNNAWIGAGASIRQNICVGEGAVVGMGAVVVKNVPAYATVVGNPAKIIKTKAEKET